MLRALAAMLVVMSHTDTIFRTAHSAPFGGLFKSGNRGVDLFFVLSGFIIAYVHRADLDRPRRIGRYLFNRVTRIYPAVWIMTLLALVVYMVGFGGAGKADKLDITAIGASFLLLPQEGAPLVNVTWTLTYEVFFYAVFAIAILNLRLGLILFLVWQVATVIVTLSGMDLGLTGYYLRAICLEFSLGMGCAWWLMRTPDARYLWRYWGVLAAGIATFVAGLALSSSFASAEALCALGATGMILALVRLEQADRIQVPAFLVRLGGASYAIYIVHYSVIALLAAVVLRKLHLPPTDALCLACAGIAVCCGLAFDYCLDRPIQRALRRWKGARRPAPATAKLELTP
jgi:peptidoglycan/LPS O-acetylase OafA/YrhL